MASRLPVLLFVPNLIGYVRVIAQFSSYYNALHNPRISIACYLLGQALDAVDGIAARVLGQASEMGRVLDMVTDRCSTTCFCLVLAHLYPERIGVFTFLVTLDLFSHWYHMHATLLAAGVSHKSSSNWVVRLYYHKPILFLTCAGTELWYTSLYALAKAPEVLLTVPFSSPAAVFSLWRAVFIAASPIFLLKQVTNIVQLAEAIKAVVAVDDTRRKEG